MMAAYVRLSVKIQLWFLLYELDRQSYSAYHHLLTLITCSTTFFLFLMMADLRSGLMPVAIINMKEKRSSSCDKISQEMASFSLFSSFEKEKTVRAQA